MKPRAQWGLPPLAVAGVVACSSAIPAMGVLRVLAFTESPARVWPAAIATALALPLQVWLVASAARGRRSTRDRWLLVVFAVIVVGMLPIVGVMWLGALFPLSALVLLVMPRPYAFVAFAGLVVLPIPLVHAFQAKAFWADYFVVGTLMYGLGVAVPVWLAAAATELRQTRAALVERAVLVERLRIDRELGPTVGAALTSIADEGDHASQRVLSNPASSATTIQAVVALSRRTLAEVRRLVGGYQSAPPSSEARSVQRLLEASGISVRMAVPRRGLPPALTDDERRRLQAEVAKVLMDGSVRACLVSATVQDGIARIDITVESRVAGSAPIPVASA